MQLAVVFREQLNGVSTWIAEELDHLIAQIQGTWNVEHDADGHHKDITGWSLTLTKDATTGKTGAIVAGGAVTAGGAGTFGGAVTANNGLDAIPLWESVLGEEAINGSVAGPAIRLGRSTNALAWWIAADHLHGGINQKRLVFIPAPENTALRFAMQLSNDAAGGSGTYYLTPNGNTGGVLNIGAPIGVFGAGHTVSVYGTLNGNVVGGPIAFPATEVASADANTLDDYEEGSWTPTITGTGGGSGQVYSVQVGRYLKIGKGVRVSGRITLSTLGTVTGQATIGGLPFPVENVTNVHAPIHFGYFGGLTTAIMWLGGIGVAGASRADIYILTAAATNPSGMVQADLSNVSDFIFDIIYRTDS